MRKLSRKKFLESVAIQMQTMGSETSQYHEERKPIGISLVAASENESSPNRRIFQVISRKRYHPENSRGRKALLVRKAQEVTNRGVSRSRWEAAPQRVKVPYAKTLTTSTMSLSSSRHVWLE